MDIVGGIAGTVGTEIVKNKVEDGVQNVTETVNKGITDLKETLSAPFQKKEGDKDDRTLLEKLKDGITEKIEEVKDKIYDVVKETGVIVDERKVPDEVVKQRKMDKLKKFVPKASFANITEFQKGEIGALTETEQEDEEKQQKKLADQEKKKEEEQDKKDKKDEEQNALDDQDQKDDIQKDQQVKKKVTETFTQKRSHRDNFIIKDKFVKDEKDKSTSQTVYEEIARLLKERGTTQKDKRYSQIILNDVVSRKNLKNQVLYFFFVTTEDQTKDKTLREHIYICPEKPTDSTQIYDFEFQDKKKRKFFEKGMFVDPLGNQIVVSVIQEEGSQSFKHIYVNIPLELKKFTDQNKDKPITGRFWTFAIGQKHEFELKSDYKKYEIDFGAKAGQRYHVITTIAWNLDEWYANLTPGSEDSSEFPSFFLGTYDSKIFTAKQNEPNAGTSLITNFVYDIVPLMKRDDIDTIQKDFNTYKYPIPISGIELFRFDGGSKNSQVTYIFLVSTFVCGFVFKSTQRVATKFFEDYYSPEKTTGKIPKYKNLKANQKGYDIPTKCPVGRMSIFRTRRSRKDETKSTGKSAHLGRPYSYCWFSDAGIVHGKVLEDDENFFAPNNSTLIESIPQILNEKGDRTILKKKTPETIAMTQFHIFVHYNLDGVSQIDVYLQPGELPTIKEESSKGQAYSNLVYNNYGDGYDTVHSIEENYGAQNGGIILFCAQEKTNTQEGSKFCLGETFELNIKNPGLDVWKIYLERAQDPNCNPQDVPLFFFKAYILCNNDLDKNRVKSAEGDFFYSRKKYVEAGLAYSKTDRPFEEIVTKFINQGEGDSDGLRVYIEELYKIETNPVPLSSLVFWLTTLHCQRINKYESLIKQKYDLECSEEEKIIRKKQKSNAIKNYERARADFETFLKEPKYGYPNPNQPVNIFELCKEQMYEIIKSAGLQLEYLTLAKHVKDYEKLVQFRIYSGEYVGLMYGYRTLCKFCAEDDVNEKKEEKKEETRQKEDVQSEGKRKKNMWYKYLPLLMTEPTDQKDYEKEQKVSEIILKEFTEKKSGNINLDPQKVVPSLLQYLYPTNKIEENLERRSQKETDLTKSSTRTFINSKSKPEERVLKFLNFSITDQKDKSHVVHNLKVLLLAQMAKESNNLNELNQYLKGEGGEIHYSKEFGFRQCYNWNLYEACITLYNKMKLYENAVQISLENNNHVKAKDSILIIKKDKDLKRRLLLKVLTHLIEHVPTNELGELLKEQALENKKEAVKLLTEFPDDINLEDVFKKLPDESILPPFMGDIIRHLKKYQNETEELQSEMRESTYDSESIRQEIAKTSQKIADVTMNDSCFKCGGGILYAPIKSPNENRPSCGKNRFYSFPCGHYYHMDCLCWSMLDLLEEKKNNPFYGSETVRDVLIDLFEKETHLDKDFIDQKIKEKLNAKDYDREFNDFCELDEKLSKYKKKENVQTHKSKAAKIKHQINEIKEKISKAKQNEKAAMELDQLISKNCPYDTKIFVDLIQLQLTTDVHAEESWSIKKQTKK